MKPKAFLRRRWMLAGKAIATGTILFLLLGRIDLQQSAGAMRNSIGLWLGFAFIASATLLIISTYKWGRLLRVVGVVANYTELLKVYTIGFFVSSFLPGVIGGDAARWHLAGPAGGRVRVAATIIAERVTGVVTLIAMSALAILVAVPAFATPPVFILLASITAAVMIGIAILLNRRLAVWGMALVRRIRARRLVQPVYDLLGVMRGLSKLGFAEALVYSVGFYVSAGISFWMISMAFQIEVTLVEATAVQALISLLTLIPISFGGLGLAQVGDVYLLGILGVPASEALGISLMRQVIAYGYVAIGGLLYIAWEGRSTTVPVIQLTTVSGLANQADGPDRVE